jgi:hypothetical protein
MSSNESKVLWNSEMSECVGFTADIDKAEFIEELKSTYIKATGKKLDINSFSLLELGTTWIFTNFEIYRSK